MCCVLCGPGCVCRFAVLFLMFSLLFCCSVPGLFAVLSPGSGTKTVPRGMGFCPGWSGTLSRVVWDDVPGGLGHCPRWSGTCFFTSPGGSGTKTVPGGLGQSRGVWDKNCPGGSGSVPGGMCHKLSMDT